MYVQLVSQNNSNKFGHRRAMRGIDCAHCLIKCFPDPEPGKNVYIETK
jgi:hypothetical protein